MQLAQDVYLSYVIGATAVVSITNNMDDPDTALAIAILSLRQEGVVMISVAVGAGDVLWQYQLYSIVVAVPSFTLLLTDPYISMTLQDIECQIPNGVNHDKIVAIRLYPCEINVINICLL